jgi:hypothetical protein
MTAFERKVTHLDNTGWQKKRIKKSEYASVNGKKQKLNILMEF